ncbi:MAG: hypothetical protein R2780_01455 [Crocinitomicaceae bacterium]|nr:hypothetical protein [Crocinitomicaceae bacterium]
MLNLPPYARVWVFQANRFLKPEEVTYVQDHMRDFIGQWASHGNELYGDFAVEYNLFLVVGADESKSPTSGCSIDSLNRKIREIGDVLGIDFFDRLKIAYEDASTKIHIASMGEFKDLMAQDRITGQTTVYNNLVENVGELDEKWRTIVKHSWHKNLLQIL